jgi:hypothetical protein
LIGVFPPCAQLPLPFAEPHVGLPTDILEACGELFQPELEMAPHRRRVARGPGPFDQGASGMGMTRLGKTSLPPALATVVFRGGKAEITHEVSGVVKAGAVPELSRDGHGDGERHSPQGLEGLDQGALTPSLDMFVEGLLQALEAFAVLVDRPDVLLEDDLLRGRGTDDLGEPAQVSGAPGGPARISDILPQQKGVETELGGLEIAEGVLAGTTEVTDRVILDCGDIDGGKIPRAHQRGQWHGVTPVGLDAMASFLGGQGRRDNPAEVPPGGEIPIEPRATRTRLVDEDQVWAFRLQLTNERVDVTRSGTDGAKKDHFGMVCWGDIGHCDRLLMHIQSNIERARLGHG